MNATHVFRQMLPATLVALGLALGPAAMAAQNPNLPPEKSQGTVAYRSGGIGEDESMAMRKIAANYPLELEFVQKIPGGHQEYVADQDVVIKDHVGRTVLHTRVGGPFLLARLPAGRYTIAATLDGKSLERVATLEPRQHERVVFTW